MSLQAFKILLVLLCLQHELILVAKAFDFWALWAEDLPAVREDKALADNFLHGAGQNIQQTQDYLMALISAAQVNLEPNLRNLNAPKVEETCHMNDGPFCLPLEKNYGHSKLHFEPPEQQDKSQFEKLWIKSIKHASRENFSLMLKAEKEGVSLVAAAIPKASYMLFLRFNSYNNMTME